MSHSIRNKILSVSQVFVLGFFSLTFSLTAHASTVTYAPSNLTLDSTSTIYGGSDMQVNSGTLLLNYNRPAVDANHIGYWTLENGNATTTTDLSGNANNGSLITAYNAGSSTWWLASSSSFNGNSAVSLTNPGQEILVSSSTSQNAFEYDSNQPWTMSAAVKLQSPAANFEGVDGVIFSNVSSQAGPYSGYEVWVDSSGFVRVRLMSGWAGTADSGDYLDVSGTTDIADNTWHFVTVTYDGSGHAAGVKIYLDGILQTMTVVFDNLSGSIVSAPQPFIIGNQNDFESNFYLHGAIDDFSLSNVARSSGYVSAHSSSTSTPPVDANTVLNYNFDEGAGNTVADSSGGGSTGYLLTPGWTAPTTAALNAAATASTSVWFGNSGFYSSSVSPDYISAPSISAYSLGNNFTITSWADSLVAPGTGGLIQDINQSSPYNGWAFYPGYQNNLQWWNGSAFTGSTVAATTGWHQYGIRFNNGTLDFLIDGSIVNTATGVAAPNAVAAPLFIGTWPGLGNWNGYISNTIVSTTTRSLPYLSQFAKRFPVSGIASLNPAVATSSGGGNFGSTVNITQLASTFNEPPLTSIKYRIGVGTTSAAATANKLTQPFSTLNATNSLNLTGQYVDYDVELFSSTDTLASSSPTVSNMSLTYTPLSAPTVTTQAASSVTTTGATANGTIVSTGNLTTTVRGAVYGTSISYGATTTESGTFSAGAFTESITGLSCGTLYHVAAYATNSQGTGYGADQSFTTSACPSTASTVVYASGGGGGQASAAELAAILAPGPATTAYLNSLNANGQPPITVNNPNCPTGWICTPSPAAVSVTPTFTRYLIIGDIGPDVKALQQYLNSHGYIIATTGPGSPGNETEKFGSLTKAALIKFQKSHGLPATGYFGPMTEAIVN